MLRRLVSLVAVLAVSSLALVEAHEGHAHKVMGTVKAVHADMKHVEVTLKDGKVSGFYFTDGTTFTRDKKAATLADLKEGMRVVVEGATQDGKLTATKVQISGAATTPAQHKH